MRAHFAIAVVLGVCCFALVTAATLEVLCYLEVFASLG